MTCRAASTLILDMSVRVAERDPKNPPRTQLNLAPERTQNIRHGSGLSHRFRSIAADLAAGRITQIHGFLWQVVKGTSAVVM